MGTASTYHSIHALDNSTVIAGDVIKNQVVSVTQESHFRNVAARSTISFSTADSFVKRENELTLLKAQLREPLRCQRAALCGLGGVGKSRIVIEFARWFLCTFPSSWAFWIDAGTQVTFSRSFEKIAEKAQLQQRAGPRADIAQVASDWLVENREPWLLVLDGVEDESFLEFPSPDQSSRSDLPAGPEILRSSYIPTRGNGVILITSRNLALTQSLGCESTHVVEVNPLDREAALTLLHTRYKAANGHERDAEELVSLLDGIPLAITQAAAYLHNKAGAVSIRDYVSYLQDEHAQLTVLQETFTDLVRRNTPNNSILHTWRITFDHIRGENVHASNLLSIVGFLDDSVIPETLLVPTDNSTFDFKTKHIPMLLRFSLIEAVESGEDGPKQYKVHKLVQLAIRAWLGRKNEQDYWKDQVLRRVNAVFPYGEERWSEWRVCANLFPHVRKVLSHTSRSGDAVLRADLLCKAAWYHRQRGNYDYAALYCQESFGIRKSTLGVNHPATLHTSKELAHIYRDLQKWREAETALQLVLGGCDEGGILDIEQTLDSRSLVGELKVLQGLTVEGQQILQSVLEEQRGRLGSMNQYTLLTTRKLGFALFRQGKRDEAETHLKYAWDHQKIHPGIGIQHLNTIRTGILLAELYSAQDSSYASAVDVLNQVLEACKSLLGLQHTETLEVERRQAEAYDALIKQRRHTL